MGCWNGTCGISRLPIRWCDPVRAFLIAPTVGGLEGNSSGYTYETDIFYPRCLPFRATYDDYGGVQEIEHCLNTDIILAQLQSDVIEKSAEKHREEINKGLSLEEFLRLISQNLLEVSNGYKQPSVTIGLFLVHEHVFNALVKSQPKESVKDFVSYLKDCSDLNSRLANAETAKSKELMVFLELLRLSPGGLQGTMCPHSSDVRFYNKYLVDAIASGYIDMKSVVFKELLKEVAEFKAFFNAMGEGRIGWMPQPGAGSQNDSTKVQKAIAKAIQTWKPRK